MRYMIDIETLGTGKRAVIVQIGVASFDEEKLFEAKSWEIDFTDQIGYRDVDAGAIRFWITQAAQMGPEAIDAIYPTPLTDAMYLSTALINMRQFMGGKLGKKDEIWACPPGFDLDILDTAFDDAGGIKPWHYRHIRDYRTVRQQAKKFKGFHMLEREGVFHNAKDDAIYQAENLLRIEEMMRTGVVPK